MSSHPGEHAQHTPDERSAPQISRLSAVTHLIAGRDAYLVGHSVLHCPWSPTGPVDERFAAHWWRKGYALARLDATSSDEILDQDDEE
ncbi:MAG: hypothetical protein F2667_00150 [Actinobacteria bacterium]|uniref:Unannotated protein n=1 Tax=freshwater metagenome TaxID=449393 RepID=A0A6J6NDX3_9ZZZZ|nr:hypothetical protein [Actinomycetota bacterium]